MQPLYQLETHQVPTLETGLHAVYGRPFRNLSAKFWNVQAIVVVADLIIATEKT
jgi:hypothetical protein